MTFWSHKVPVIRHTFCPGNPNVFSFLKTNFKKKSEPGHILFLFYFCGFPEISQTYTWLSSLKHILKQKFIFDIQ